MRAATRLESHGGSASQKPDAGVERPFMRTLCSAGRRWTAKSGRAVVPDHHTFFEARWVRQKVVRFIGIDVPPWLRP